MEAMTKDPDVQTILLEAPDGKPRGLREPPIGPIAPKSAMPSLPRPVCGYADRP